MLPVIEILPKAKENPEHLLRKYKRKLDRIHFLKKLKQRVYYKKRSQVKKEQVQRARLREQYKHAHGLI